MPEVSEDEQAEPVRSGGSIQDHEDRRSMGKRLASWQVGIGNPVEVRRCGNSSGSRSTIL
jgi:hypothetical protein